MACRRCGRFDVLELPPFCGACWKSGECYSELTNEGRRTSRFEEMSAYQKRGLITNAEAKRLLDAPMPPDSDPRLDSVKRKQTPVFSGVLMYFPRTMRALARLSWAGNEKHNPGQPLHWSRGKSADHADCCVRHLMTGEELDPESNEYHAVHAAWRACANAELILEKKEVK